MRIVYNKNPCLSKIILEDTEKELFIEKFKVEHFISTLHRIKYLLDKNSNDISKSLQKELDYYYNEKLKQEAEYYLIDLESGVHIGDCTCVPCTCSKCYAEGIFGVSTIEGVGKHHLYKIDNYFSKNPDSTIDEAIDYLVNHYGSGPVPDNWKNSEESYWNCMGRWKEEAKQAAKWLDKTHRENLKQNDRYKIVPVKDAPEYLFVEKGLEITDGYVQYVTIKGNKFSSSMASMALYRKV